MNATLLLAAVAATAAVVPAPGENADFGNWTIGCDNGRSCKAVSLNDFALGDEVVTLVISRTGAAHAPAMLDVSGHFEEVVKVITLWDEKGRQIVSLPLNDGRFSAPIAQATLQALLAGASITARSGAGNVLGHASLAGLSASLRAMDAAQKRADTVTALVARGDKPASAVPAPPALPIITYRTPGGAAAARPAKAEIARLRRATQCTDDEGEYATAEAMRVDPAHTLILLSCGHGAYNYMTVPFILSGKGKARRLKPAKFDYNPGQSSPEGDGSAMLVNAVWDDKEAVLSTFDRARGFGDCGTTEHYVWDGARFRLTDFRMMGDCRQAMDWPVLWRAETVRGK